MLRTGVEEELPKGRDRMLRDSNEVHHEVFKEDGIEEGKRVREREKRKQPEDSENESDDAAVAARIKRALPKPSALTMGVPTPFVTAGVKTVRCAYFSPCAREVAVLTICCKSHSCCCCD